MAGQGDTIFMLLFGLALIGYVFFYIGGRQYLREYFQGDVVGSDVLAGSASPTIAELSPPPPPTAKRDPTVLMEYPNKPYTTESIQNLDTYDYNFVYENESDRGMSQALRNKLMSQRPMDWSGQPPSSAQFQAGLREYFQNEQAPPATSPTVGSPYEPLDGERMNPKDALAEEEKERAGLQSYEPKQPDAMTTYDVDDAMQLIEKIYDAKGEIPTVYHEEGSPVYEITGVRRKDEKIVYEDEEAPAASGPVRGAGEATIDVPMAAMDTAAGKDPYYDPTMGGKSRIGKWDYTGWTPGLERMFAPTEPRQDWY